MIVAKPGNQNMLSVCRSTQSHNGLDIFDTSDEFGICHNHAQPIAAQRFGLARPQRLQNEQVGRNSSAATSLKSGGGIAPSDSVFFVRFERPVTCLRRE
jgi:hypothetical protein